MTEKAIKWMIDKCLLKASKTSCMIERGYYMDECRKYMMMLHRYGNS